tara:strand:+ start:1327 stop:2202 length:876 start_codon:yes stop_codon:yes gene_type:complete
MPILSVNTPYVDGATVTSTNLNALVNDATLVAGVADGVTTELSSGSIIVRDGGISINKLNTSLSGAIELQGTAYVGGAKGGNTRGSNSLDIQVREAGFPGTMIASGTRSMSFGRHNTVSGDGGIGVGDNCESTKANAISFGRSAQAKMSTGIAIGNGVTVNHATNEQGVCIGFNSSCSADRSTAFGNLVGVSSGSSSGTMELGNWSVDPTTGGRFNGFSGNSIRMHYDRQVAFSIADKSNDDPTDGGSIAGNEPSGTLPRGMFTFQKDFDDVKMFYNDQGTIKSLSLGSLA